MLVTAVRPPHWQAKGGRRQANTSCRRRVRCVGLDDDRSHWPARVAGLRRAANEGRTALNLAPSNMCQPLTHKYCSAHTWSSVQDLRIAVHLLPYRTKCLSEDYCIRKRTSNSRIRYLVRSPEYRILPWNFPILEYLDETPS